LDGFHGVFEEQGVGLAAALLWGVSPPLSVNYLANTPSKGLLGILAK
jgi:hypothetical protein